MIGKIFTIVAISAAGYLAVSQTPVASQWLDERFETFSNTSSVNDWRTNLDQWRTGIDTRIEALSNQTESSQIAELQIQVEQLSRELADLRASQVDTESGNSVLSQRESSVTAEIEEIDIAKAEEESPVFMSNRDRRRELLSLAERMEMQSLDQHVQ